MADKRGKLKIGSDNFYPAPFFPIGSVYISVVNTNPSTWFGGTWDQFGQGRTLVGVNTSDTDFNAVEKIGGEKAHKLTVEELPDHHHDEYATANPNTGGPGVRGTFNGIEDHGQTAYKTGAPTGGCGNDKAHNNLQPYITVYFWKRTA